MANTTNFGWETPDDTDLVKDGAAAMRTLGNSIDASFVDLKGGTTGQVLAKNSNTDLDFVWTNGGDITEVAAGVGISGGGTSGSVTITNSMATAIDAKGDLVVGTGADTFSRLASSGVNNDVLTVDTSTATGLKWAAVNGWSPNFQLINAGGTALTGASTITVSGISNKNALLIFVDGASSVNASSVFTIRLNSDSTSANYIIAGGRATQITGWDNYYSAPTSFPFGSMGNTAGTAVTGIMHLYGTNQTGWKTSQIGSYANGTGTNEGFVLTGAYKGNSAISSVSIISSSGNFDAGTIFVYGA